EGMTITATMVSTDFDAYLHLVDASGNQLVQNDDDATMGAGPDGAALNSKITFVAPSTGTYSIWANTRSAGDTGAYTVTINTTAPGRAGGGGLLAPPLSSFREPRALERPVDPGGEIRPQPRAERPPQHDPERHPEEPPERV